jgi:hypothetical protein
MRFPTRRTPRFEQLEPRRVLTAIANGQEIEGTVNAGSIQSFEFNATVADIVQIGW